MNKENTGYRKPQSYKKPAGKRVDLKFKKADREKMDLFAIYPDHWPRKWGDPPLLGFVHSEDEFNAVRKAEFRGIYRRNYSFGPVARKVSDKTVRLGRKDLYRK